MYSISLWRIFIMPMPMPNGQQITIYRRLLPSNYCMPSMQVMTDYYNIGYTFTGDRHTVTPTESFSYHSGDVSLMSPLIFHRTLSLSDTPYESILIKFTPEFIKPFIEIVGTNQFNSFYNNRKYSFTDKAKLRIQKIFEDMLEEYNKDTYYKELILQGMLFHLFTTIMEEHIPDEQMTKRRSELSKDVIEILYYLETNYQDNPTLSEMAQMANISEGHLSRLFSSQLGITFSKYLSNVKLNHVKALLQQTDKSITEIALITGYCNSDYLSACFKKQTGMTPKEFRKKIRCDGTVLPLK